MAFNAENRALLPRRSDSDPERLFPSLRRPNALSQWSPARRAADRVLIVPREIPAGELARKCDTGTSAPGDNFVDVLLSNLRRRADATRLPALPCVQVSARPRIAPQLKAPAPRFLRLRSAFCGMICIDPCNVATRHTTGNAALCAKSLQSRKTSKAADSGCQTDNDGGTLLCRSIDIYNRPLYAASGSLYFSF